MYQLSLIFVLLESTILKTSCMTSVCKKETLTQLWWFQPVLTLIHSELQVQIRMLQIKHKLWS